MPDLKLVPITVGNYESASRLSVRPDQEGLVASIQKSLADAYVYADALFRLAVVDGQEVGYLLLFPFDSDRGRTVNIVRLMIDQRHQGQGLGRALLEQALAWIGTFDPPVSTVRISAVPRNTLAIGLYERTGFVRAGMEAGEVALYLDLGNRRDGTGERT